MEIVPLSDFVGKSQSELVRGCPDPEHELCGGIYLFGKNRVMLPEGGVEGKAEEEGGPELGPKPQRTAPKFFQEKTKNPNFSAKISEIFERKKNSLQCVFAKATGKSQLGGLTRTVRAPEDPRRLQGRYFRFEGWTGKRR